MGKGGYFSLYQVVLWKAVISAGRFADVLCCNKPDCFNLSSWVVWLLAIELDVLEKIIFSFSALLLAFLVRQIGKDKMWMQLILR